MRTARLAAKLVPLTDDPSNHVILLLSNSMLFVLDIACNFVSSSCAKRLQPKPVIKSLESRLLLESSVIGLVILTCTSE